MKLVSRRVAKSKRKIEIIIIDDGDEIALSPGSKLRNMDTRGSGRQWNQEGGKAN